MEDQIKVLKDKTDRLLKATPTLAHQNPINHIPAAVGGLNGTNLPVRESLNETLDIVDGQKVDPANPEIKYLMDEVHLIQGKMKKLETENQKLKNEMALNANKRNPVFQGKADEEYKAEGFDLNKYIGVYQGVDDVIKLDNKLTKFIDFQTN